jgi:plasmid segregation protein ParM
MNERIFAVVDAGKYETKSFAITMQNEKKKIKNFRTKMIDNTNDYDLAGNSYKVEFEGKKVIIGEQGTNVDYDILKTGDTHMIALYTCLSQYVEQNGQHCQLVFGCPANTFKIKENKEEFKETIMRNKGNINITVNNRDYNYIIDNVLLMLEGSGIVFLRPDIFKGNTVAVIDQGGLNMNFCVYRNQIPDVDTLFNINKGGFDLESEIMKALNAKFNRDIDTKSVQQIVKQGYLKLDGQIVKESIQIIDKIIERFNAETVQAIAAYGIDLSLVDAVVAVGGTTNIVAKSMKKFIPHIQFVDNAQDSNIEGWGLFGKKKYESLNNKTN